LHNALTNHRPQSAQIPSAKAARRSSYWHILPYLKSQSRLILQAFLCTVGFISTMPILAEILGRVADAIGHGDVPGIIQIALFILSSNSS
jgi:ATP-binding cassette subfamily B protein